MIIDSFFKYLFGPFSIGHSTQRNASHYVQVAKRHDLPIILHTRKAEARVLEMLLEEQVVKADFHCFCGKVLNFTFPLLLDCVHILKCL